MPPRAIFVIGRHRSGTTWLSNILASIDEIYAPSHARHRGLHESGFFSHLVRYCNHGRTVGDLLAIKHLFERSDFFLLTQVPEGPDIVQHGSAGYFRIVMETAASRHSATYWLEKTPAHTLHTRFLLEAFPEAVFVAVIRNYRDVVASNVHGFGKPGSVWSWFRQSAVTAIYEKVIQRNEVFVVRYEDLRDAYEATVASVLEALGLKTDLIPADDFGKNTSFEGSVPRITWWQQAALVSGRYLVWIWPANLVENAVIRWRSKKRGSLPKWFFLIGASESSSDPWQ